VSPRANTIIKNKERGVISFAGTRPGAADSDDDSADGDHVNGDADDDGGDADDSNGGSDDDPKPKSKPRKPELPPVGTALLTTQQAAGYLACSPQFLDKLRHKGGGPAYVRLGTDLIRYTKAELDRYIAKRTFKNTAQTDVALE
jgi:predicted DNA-binding transcriptional regulator AlpA